jgi:hypothetical protein
LISEDRKLCQEILTTDPMLIIVAIEVSVQNLMKDIREASESEKSTTDKSGLSLINSNRSPPPLFHSPGSEGHFSSIKESACLKKEPNPGEEPRTDETENNEEGARKEAKENHTFLSPDQEARVKKAASGFTDTTEVLIRNANNEAKLLCREGTHMNSAAAKTAIEEIVRTLVDALVRCKDRKKMDEQSG